MLAAEYINTGKITFEYRDFAFLGPESGKAAEAAWCALDQDRFWDYHDTVFANHAGENKGAYSDKRLKQMAELVGLDMEQFNTCFDDRVHKDDVSNAYDDGSALGVNRTPTLIINGEMVQYSGVDNLRAKLDEVIGS